MSCYTVDYTIDVMDAFDNFNVQDQKDFLVSAIHGLISGDDYAVVEEAMESLTDDQCISLIEETFENLDSSSRLDVVSNLADRLTEAERKELKKQL